MRRYGEHGTRFGAVGGDALRLRLGAALLQDGLGALVRLRLVRGRSRRTARRVAAAAAALGAALGMLGAPPLAGRAAALPSQPNFAAPETNPFGLGGLASRKSFANLRILGTLNATIDALAGGDLSGGLWVVGNRGTVTVPDFIDLGGFLSADHPAPALGDIDADGIADAIVGTGGGDFLFLKGASSGLFQSPDSAQFGLFNVGVFAVPALADIDGDGDLDLFVGTGYGDTVLFRNTGTATVPSFSAPTTNPFGLSNVGTFAVPALVDIDGDGDLDAFVGSFSGTAVFFENTGTATAPAFAAPVSNPFGLSPGGALVAPAFADVDGDGDFDALLSDPSGTTLFFRNYALVVERVFPAIATDFMPLPNVGRDAVPTLADIDGDGDLDVFVGNELGDLRFFRNTGSATAPVLAAGVNNPFGLANLGAFAVPAFADLDLDADLDALVGLRDGTVAFFRNAGTAVAPAFTHGQGELGFGDVGDFAAPAFGDIDGDGDLDAVVGNYTFKQQPEGEPLLVGETIFFRNEGNSVAPDFVADTATMLALPSSAKRPVPALVDLDGDGDLDVLVGTGDGDTMLFRNTGDATTAAFAAGVANPLGLVKVVERAAPALADLDGDGDLDALIGTGEGETIVLPGGPIPPPATETPTPTPTATRANTRTHTATPTDLAEEPSTPTATATAGGPATATATGAATATATRQLSATATATGQATPTATGGPGACAGDCDGSGDVSIGEVISLVNIALGNREISTCPAGDRNGDGMIAVNELVAASLAAQNNCAR